jgi:DedD protein
VSAADSVDKDEEVVDAPPAAPAAKAPAAVAAARPESVATQPSAVTKPEPKVEHKAEPAKPEHRDAPKAEHKDAKAEARLAEKERAEREKAEQKAQHDRAEHEKAERLAREAREKAKKAEDKPVKPKDDAARAVAILEGKPAEKEKPAESSSQRFVLQVAALSSQEKAAEVQAKLREAGISSYTQKTSTPNGELIRVRVGPLSKEDAEKVRAKLGRLGMSGAMTPV